MEAAINRMIDQFLKPTRTNYSNLLWNENEHLRAFEQIKFNVTTMDGLRLSCILFRLSGYRSTEKTPTVVYSHAYCSSKFESVNLLAQCKRSQMSLCIYDSRGCGDSGGEFITFGYKECHDLLFVLFRLIVDYGINHFALWGRSIGCNTVLMLHYKLNSSSSFVLNRERRKRGEPPLPESWNVFIMKNYEEYARRNGGPPLANGVRIQMFLICLVLDVPYFSFNSFIKDNVRRFVPMLPGMLTETTSSYVIERINTKHRLDLRQNQNKFLMKKTNMNTVIIVSDRDEIVPYRRFEKMIARFGEDVKPRIPIKVINCAKEHGVKRDEVTLSQAFAHITNVTVAGAMQRHEHVHVTGPVDPNLRIRNIAPLVPTDMSQLPGDEVIPVEEVKPQKVNYNPMMTALRQAPAPDMEKVSLAAMEPRLQSIKDIMRDTNVNAEHRQIMEFVQKNELLEGKSDGAKPPAPANPMMIGGFIPVPGAIDSANVNNSDISGRKQLQKPTPVQMGQPPVNTPSTPRVPPPPPSPQQLKPALQPQPVPANPQIRPPPPLTTPLGQPPNPHREPQPTGPIGPTPMTPGANSKNPSFPELARVQSNNTGQQPDAIRVSNRSMAHPKSVEPHPVVNHSQRQILPEAGPSFRNLAAEVVQDLAGRTLKREQRTLALRS